MTDITGKQRGVVHHYWGKEVGSVTDMKRLTVAFPEEVDRAVLALGATERFAGWSYSQLVRYLVRRGLEAEDRRELEEARRRAAWRGA